jgi:cytochrome b561
MNEGMPGGFGPGGPWDRFRTGDPDLRAKYETPPPEGYDATSFHLTLWVFMGLLFVIGIIAALLRGLSLF